MKYYFFLFIILLGIGCSATTRPFYNRDGWSYSFTKNQYDHKIRLKESEAIREKAVPVFIGALVSGKAEIEVLVDKDAVIVAAILVSMRGLDGQELPLMNAARESVYKKIRNENNSPIDYTTILTYQFQ